VKLKSPGKRAVRGLAVTGVALASVTGLVMSQTAALADPSITYLAVGSDTTQKFMDAFSVDLAGNLLASEDAVNPTSTTTNQVSGQVVSVQKTGTGITGTPPVATGITASYANPQYCSFTRPNGSGAGANAARQSMGSIATITTAAGQTVTVTGPATNGVAGNDTVTGPGPNNAPQIGCVDVVRSSSAPGSANVDPTAGNLIYIPFALDSVAASIGSTGNLTALNSTTSTLSLPQLQAMYSTGVGQVVGTVCYQPTGGTTCAGTGFTTTSVDLYVPQSGSGTRNFWLTKMDGSVPSTLPAWVFDHIQSDGGQTTAADVGLLVEEHDGTAVSADPNGIGPFSVSQWIQEQKPGFGHSNFVANAVVIPMELTTGATPIAAFTGTLPNASLVITFPVLREVYNALQYDRVVNTGDGQFDANLAGLFVGGSSQICQDTPEILAFGFATLSTAPLTHHCGDIDTTHLRAFGPSTGF
jgi:hypothetical protein